MRLPSMMTPLPESSSDGSFVQGLNGSGRRTVEKTLTTELSTRPEPTAGASARAGAAASRAASDARSAKARRGDERMRDKNITTVVAPAADGAAALRQTATAPVCDTVVAHAAPEEGRAPVAGALAAPAPRGRAGRRGDGTSGGR